MGETTVVLQFLSPIHKAGRQLGLFLGPRVERHGVTPDEGHLVSFLRAYSPCAVGELRRIFGLRRSTLTSMLDRLEAKKFLTRTLHPEDRRSFLVNLTPSGRRLGGKIQKDVDELESAIRKEVRASDIQGFERVLEAVAKVTQVEVRNGESK